MTKILLQTIAVLIFLFLATGAKAQSQTSRPWASEKGYWVVESNKQTPKNAVVYFYNNDHLLVYKEELTNHKLKLAKPKTLLRLKAALEEAIDKSEKNTWAVNNGLVIKYLQN